MTTQPVSRARASERLQLLLAGRVDERLDADVVALAAPGRAARRASRCDRAEVGLAACEHLARLVLRRLHVGLVERVDPEHVPATAVANSQRKNSPRQVVGIDDLDLAALAVRPVGRLAGRRHEPLALLAGRLGDQLLRPEAEAGRRLFDADLVAALLPALAEPEPELEPRVAVLLVAGQRPSPPPPAGSARRRRPSARPARSRTSRAPSSGRRSPARRRRWPGSRARSRAARAPSPDR